MRQAQTNSGKRYAWRKGFIIRCSRRCLKASIREKGCTPRNAAIKTLIHHARLPQPSPRFHHPPRRLAPGARQLGLCGRQREDAEAVRGADLETNLAALRNEVLQGSYAPAAAEHRRRVPRQETTVARRARGWNTPK